MRFLVSLVLVVTACSLSFAAFAQNNSSDDPVVVTVNGEHIRRSEVVTFHATLPAQYQNVPLDKIFDDLMTNLINRKMIVQAARAEGMNETPEVRRRLSFFLDGLLQELYISREIAAVLTEEHLRASYERMLRLAPPQEEVHARHILVEKRETAQDLIEKLGSGEDFATLAQRHSKGPSAKSGGDLGYFGREQMVPEFAEVAFALEPGAVSQKPIQTKFGWHVIKVEDRRAAQPPSFEESAPQLLRDESRAIVANIVQALSKDAKIVRVQRQAPKSE